MDDDDGADELDRAVTPLIRERALQGQRAIGWYHVHSTLGVFLSPGEAEFHMRRFPEMWQVAIVLLEDSERPAAGVFLRSSDGDLPRSGYASFYERLHRSSLLPEGRKRSFVGWSNHATEEPVVLAGSDGVSDRLSDGHGSTSSGKRSPSNTATLADGPASGAAVSGGLAAVPGAENPGAAVPGALAPGGAYDGRGSSDGASKTVTPADAGFEEEVGPSEIAHDRAQMKRALSAVDFSITALPGPPPTPTKTSDEDSDQTSAVPSSTDLEPPVSQPEAGSGLSGGERSTSAARETAWQAHHTRRSRSRRLSQIVWSAVGLFVVGTLLWLLTQGGRRSVRGEPSEGTNAPAEAAEMAEATAFPEETSASPTTGTSASPTIGAPTLATTGLQAPPSDGEAQPKALSANERTVPGGQGDPVDLTGETVPPPRDPNVDDPLTVSGSMRAEFLSALEIFGQETAGYQERRDAYTRGLVGCNALNSWYRSVGEAFVRLSSKVAEAGPEAASAWSAEYETARASMDEIDRHYLSSECPLPR